MQSMVVSSTENMLMRRGIEYIRLDDQMVHHDVVKILRKRICIPTTPVWYTPSRRLLTSVSNLPKLPIQYVREIWEVSSGGTQEELCIEIVSQNDIGRNIPIGCRISIVRWWIVLMRVVDHVLVPPHEHISREECPWPASTLPKLLRSDPIAMYMGFRTGDIIKIQRHHRDPKRAHFFYRVVV